MGQFYDINGNGLKRRRSVGSSESVSKETVLDPQNLADALTRALRRIGDLEAKSAPESMEFEVNLVLGTKVRLEHGFGSPVRYYVTHWVATTASDSPLLSVSSATDTNSLVLIPECNGKAVIRVERSVYPVNGGPVPAAAVAASGDRKGYVNINLNGLAGPYVLSAANGAKRMFTFHGTPLSNPMEITFPAPATDADAYLVDVENRCLDIPIYIAGGPVIYPSGSNQIDRNAEEHARDSVTNTKSPRTFRTAVWITASNGAMTSPYYTETP